MPEKNISLVLGSGSARGYAPNIIIGAPNNVCGFYKFNRAYELIELGRIIAREELEESILRNV